MDETRLESAGPFDEQTVRREAVRTVGAAGAALLGMLGLAAKSSDAGAQSNRQVGSEKKGKKGRRGPAGPAGATGPTGPQGEPSPSSGALYWALVNSDGQFVAGHGFTRARNIGGKTGEYSVSTDGEESFTGCAIVGMADDGNRIVRSAAGLSSGSIGLRTQRFASDAEPPTFVDVDSAFSLIVICPPS